MIQTNTLERDSIRSTVSTKTNCYRLLTYLMSRRNSISLSGQEFVHFLWLSV